MRRQRASSLCCLKQAYVVATQHPEPPNGAAARLLRRWGAGSRVSRRSKWARGVGDGEDRSIRRVRSQRQLQIILGLGTPQPLAGASIYYLPAILADAIARDLGVS